MREDIEISIVIAAETDDGILGIMDKVPMEIEDDDVIGVEGVRGPSKERGVVRVIERMLVLIMERGDDGIAFVIEGDTSMLVAVAVMEALGQGHGDHELGIVELLPV